ncbi:hypothetical protein CUROG_04045 [Corynebacterium urogenitale]|uniref:Uncharacterized protein n=1 Tax=Corynebacterium urogenitale TaxID=2487892 RepID=A0A5J6Z502_9CORY|nr:hypothetical protein [Corynebacterium urogenitale]QFQ02188.1 hypothetical protein CUROG_04045 [Corynebacterium urogenitale]
MALTIESLLRASASAAVAGDTRKSWELISSYATDFWLVDESEVPPELLGEFYPVRAAAADWLGLSDEAITALQSMERWAKEHDNHELALVAAAHLAYQSLNQPDHAVFPLPDASLMLADVAERFLQWRPHPEAPTIGEDESLTWNTVSKRQAAALTTAAATAHTVASSINSAPPNNTSPTNAEATGIDAARLQEFFTQLVWRFGKNPANKMDELLWFAQNHWSSGRRTEARETALKVVELADTSAPRYEAHFMLGHFAMMALIDVAESVDAGRSLGDKSEEFAPGGETEDPPLGHRTEDPTLGDGSEDWLENQVALHWSECAELAIAMGAPVMALERAELACRMLSSLGRDGEAWSLASRMVDATQGIPMCPALLNIRAMLAQAAFVAGLHQEAWDNACSIAEWSELTPDTDRTNTCYTIATFAGLELGLEEEVMRIQQRRAALYEQVGEFSHASQVLQSIAVAVSIEFEEARALMERAWSLLERDVEGIEEKDSEKAGEQAAAEQQNVLWNKAEWHLTMANIVPSDKDVVDYATRAAEGFHLAHDPIKAASAWLTMAGGLIAQGLSAEADLAISHATNALPELDSWLQDEDEDFDPVIGGLIDYYRYIQDFRRTN